MNNGKTLRIACLHGYCQNASIFRQKTGGLRKSLERNASIVRSATSSQSIEQDSSKSDPYPLSELVYIDAPFAFDSFMHPFEKSDDKPKPQVILSPPAVPAPSSQSASNSPSTIDKTQRLWWRADDNANYVGWAESLQYLRHQFQQQKFDGILGFSQGAVVASLICSLRNNAQPPIPEFASLKFGIMISGFPSRAELHKPLYAEPIHIPSMHVWGMEDKLVPPYGSQALLEKFDMTTRDNVIHNKAHLVPSDANSRAKISQFLLQFSDMENDEGDGTRAAL